MERLLVNIISTFCLILLAGFFQPFTAQTFINKAAEFGVTTFGDGVQGSGCSTFDWDEDGFDDLTLLIRDSVPIFYHNNGGNGFTRVYFDGVDLADTLMMVTWVDIDNDGDKDLAFNIYQGGPRLYRNHGDFTFEDVTAASGIIVSEDHWGYGLNWGDYDLDGDLDLYVSNYNWDSAPLGSDMLYKNNGNFSFSMVNLSAGIANEHAPTFQGVWLDYDLDLDPDLIIANDREAFTNLLYRNNGNGQFTNHTAQTNFTHFICSMCATVGDYDNDGRYDIYFTNTPFAGNRLFKFSPEVNYFQEVAGEMGVLLFQYSWGSTWFDYDNDGWQDLYVGTELYPVLETNIGADYLLRNTQNGFDWQFDAGFEEYLGTTNALSRADFNNDGFPDLLTHSQLPIGTGIWYNQLTEGNYLKIMPKGVISNKDGVGVRMELYTSAGNQYRYTLCGEQYISQNTQWQHFGLAGLSKADSLKLKWPSGHVDTFYDIDANQSLIVYEGSSLKNEILVLTGSLSFCDGGQVLLDAGEWESYLWSTGQTSRTIWVNTSDTISVEVFDGTFYIPAEPVIVQVLDQLTQDIIINSPSCSGELNGSAEIIPLEQLNNVSITWWDGLISPTHGELGAGLFEATITATAGAPCIDTISILVMDPPMFNLDSISLFIENVPGDCDFSWTAQSSSSGGTPPYNYSWQVFELDETMPFIEATGEQLQCIPADRDLRIICNAADSGTCMEELEIISKSSLGSNSSKNEQWLVYPNPSAGRINIRGLNQTDGIAIYTLRGEPIELKVRQLPDETIEIILNEHISGIFILEINHSGVSSRKLILVNSQLNE